ncbi:cation:proton antiporter [Nocardia yamanashiensis]|uniref:cation:proton antiporter n=1 Tax=Nocardia yamanashiensis TaxID=209247 RepID=UPI001E5FF868|nr:cation:proton antiporter [Nocardia yamanashiensis]UGT40595.1 cation:proton antiporter [Nocardia yamanashiensis]
MNFEILALVTVLGLAGPLLAWRPSWHLPVILGELIAGIAFGTTGFGVLHPEDPTFTFLADVGFAVVMFVAGTHVPIRDAAIRSALGIGALRAVLVGLAAVGLGVAVAAWFDTGHGLLYAVLIASSSAAIVLPIIDSQGLSGKPVLELTAQVAIADAAAVVALPLVIDTAHAGRAALGALAVAAAAAGIFFLLRHLERSGLRRRLHKISEDRQFAMELRVSLALLFLLCAIATRGHVSIMLAGFAMGLAVAGVGEPRRVAKQLFAISDGFLAPLFFIWLGARLNLREFGEHPSLILLGLALGAAAVLAHIAMRLLRQPVPLGALASAQIGVPVAAVTVGTQMHVLKPGEPAALMLGALITIAAAAVGSRRAAAASPA